MKLRIPNNTKGMIRSDVIQDTIAPADSVEEAINISFDRLGGSEVRKGITQYGTTLPGNALSITSWLQNASTVRKLLAQVGNQIYVNNSGTWTSVRTLTNTNKSRFKQFLNSTYMVNGFNGDPVQQFDGSTFTTTNCGTLPKGDYIETLEGRIWVADKSTDYIYYTDVVSPTGVISGGTEYISRFSPSDGESITGLKRFIKALYVFKQNHIYRIFGSTAADPYPIFSVGTYSNESIVEAKNGMYFHHSSGFYRFDGESQPVEISEAIQDITNAIPRSQYENIFGWSDEDHVYWHVGDITLNQKFIKNCVITYTISKNSWKLRSYFSSGTSTKQLLSAFVYDDGINIVPLVSTNTAILGDMSSGNDDLGEPIFYEQITRWLSLGELISDRFEIKSLACIHIDASGTSLSVQYDKDSINKWDDIGTYNEDYVTLMNSIRSKPCNRLRFKIKGSSTGKQPRFETIEILKVDIIGNKYN